MQTVMDCGCVIVSEEGMEPLIIYCQKHAGKDTSPRASEIIKFVEDVDSIAGRIKNDVSLLISAGVELTQFLKSLKRGEGEDNKEGTGGSD